jgi:PAS domain S-box-containing protein
MNPRTVSIMEEGRSAPSAIDVQVLAQLFDSASDVAFFVKDIDGRYVAVNDSLVKRHGLRDKSEAIGQRPIDICQGDFGLLPSEQDTKLLKTGRPLVEHLEMQWNRPNEPVWCLTTKLPIRDSNGNVCGVVGFSRDVRIPVQRGDIPEGFAHALEEFESGLSERVTPAWLAEQSQLSPQQLARFTKRVFGLTPTQFIARIRIAAASRLLRETEHTVAEIAVKCGFYDHSAFARAFRNATGVTPTRFRSQGMRSGSNEG